MSKHNHPVRGLIGFVAAVWAVMASPDPAAALRDPLTSSESEQLRAVATEPAKRLHLLITFCQTRLAALDRIVADPAQNAVIKTLILDFTAVIDEINDTLDQYAGRPLNAQDKADFRAGLQEWLRAVAGFEAKLKAYNIPVGVPAAFLKDAQDAVKSSRDVATGYLHK